MKNVMEFDNGYKAVIAYDPEIDMFRGEFVGLNGGADFYANDLAGLRQEGATSLRIFLEDCERRGITPRKSSKGNFALRLDPTVYEQASMIAQSRGTSLNSFISDAVRQAVASAV